MMQRCRDAGGGRACLVLAQTTRARVERSDPARARGALGPAGWNRLIKHGYGRAAHQLEASVRLVQPKARGM